MRTRLSFYRLRRSYVCLGRFIGAAMHAPSHCQMQAVMFAGGLLLLLLGLNAESFARPILVNQERFCEATNAVLTYVEGSFGALVLVAAGVGAIMSAAFGQFRHNP
ncbi:MAG: hypothetical protein J5J00_06675 [Deltaproteobacteria bacterium]|nr:hypothetical protein [Deltaproteobacteria bacterium]